jgi:cell division protein FtsZ
MLVNVEARGDHRVKELTERLLAHPLLEGGQALAQAGAILVCIAGGPDLSMGEVERIMEQIQRHADQAQIIMGTSIDPEWADGLSLMLVASSGAEASRAATASAVPAPPATSTPRGESDTRTGREPTAEGEAARREQTQDWVEEPAEGRRPTVAEPGANLPECDEAALQDPWNQPSEPRERRTSPFAAPPPELSQEAAEQLFRKLGGRSPFRGSNANRMRQAQLPLEIISKGRFESSVPTLYRGEDLDVPTYIRRGVPLN